MSYSIDVNILLYASDTQSSEHAAALGFMRQCATRHEPLCLCWPTLMSYLRIATHPSIFAAPLSSAEVNHNVSTLLALPQTRLITESDGFWQIYRQLCETVSVRGNLVPDAHLAALLIHNDVRTLYTNDSDFRKFKQPKVVNPLR